MNSVCPFRISVSWVWYLSSVNVSIQSLEKYIERHRGRLITATKNNTGNTSINKAKITRKQKREEKQRYGRFKRQTREISPEKTWT